MRMYSNICFRITIAEKLSFATVKSIEIKKTLQKLSNTATVVLPRNFKEAKGKRLLDFVKAGDSIKIEIGYDDELTTEFVGYVSEIGAEVPVVLECVDEMYRLRRTEKFNRTFSKVSLKEILNYIASDYRTDCVDMEFGKFMIENATAFEVLEGLKKFGIRCNFKDNVLYAGTLVDLQKFNVHRLEFGRNIRKSSNLKYKTSSQRDCLIKAVSLQKGTSKKNVYEFGNKINGERTLHAPLNLSKTALKRWAENYYKSLVFDGYEGSVNCWGDVKTEAGDTLELIDPRYSDGHRDGRFLIEEVTVSADETNGFMRSNKISVKL